MRLTVGRLGLFLLLCGASNAMSESNPLLTVFDGIKSRKTSAYSVDVAVLSMKNTWRSSGILDDCKNDYGNGSLRLIYSWTDRGFDSKLYVEKSGEYDSFVPGMPQAYLGVRSSYPISCYEIVSLRKEALERSGGIFTVEDRDRIQGFLREKFFSGNVRKAEYFYYFLDRKTKRKK